MDWGIIGFIAKVGLTVGGIKIVCILLRKLFSGETIESAISSTGKKIHKTNRNFKNYLKQKVDSKKMSKQNETPIITIR